jgi:hypothetical protein
MVGAGHIDRLITNERNAISWYLAWFGIVVSIGIGLILVNLRFGWIKEVGPSIGSAFILLLAKPPLSEVLKRRDRLAALHTLRASLSQQTPEDALAGKIDAAVWGMLQKMLEG